MYTILMDCFYSFVDNFCENFIYLSKSFLYLLHFFLVYLLNLDFLRYRFETFEWLTQDIVLFLLFHSYLNFRLVIFNRLDLLYLFLWNFLFILGVLDILL